MVDYIQMKQARTLKFSMNTHNSHIFMRFQGYISGGFYLAITLLVFSPILRKAARNISLKSHKDMTIVSIHAEFQGPSLFRLAIINHCYIKKFLVKKMFFGL